MNRKTMHYAGEELLEVTYRDVTWKELRAARDLELQRTDFWGLKDLVMSQEKKDYRKMLRDLGEFESANEAADHWASFVKPE